MRQKEKKKRNGLFECGISCLQNTSIAQTGNDHSVRVHGILPLRAWHSQHGAVQMRAYTKSRTIVDAQKDIVSLPHLPATV